MSKINCVGNNEIAGGPAVHALASGISTILLACNVTISAADLSFAAFVEAMGKSLIDARVATFSGNPIAGPEYGVYDSTLYRPSIGALPGSGSSVGDGAVVK
jgi:hypothetical protein